MTATWAEITAELRVRCAPAGLDLVQPFAAVWYNASIDAAFRLPDFGRGRALGLLIGNTRALWGPFVEDLRARPALLDDADPLDRYATGVITRALEPLSVRWLLRGASEPPPRRVGMQRLAQVSGLAHLAPSNLCVHPVFGPWIGLRAAVVIDVDGPEGEAVEPPSPCDDCAERCVSAFERAMTASGNRARDQGDIERSWSLWLAVRDACPVGREHRYGEEQIRYHYTKDREILRRAVRAAER